MPTQSFVEAHVIRAAAGREFSSQLQMLEVVLPGNFATEEVSAVDA